MALKTKSELHTEITTLFPTNFNQEISAADLRSVTNDIVDSLALATGTVQVVSGDATAGITALTSNYVNKLVIGKGIQVFSHVSDPTIALVIPVSGSANFGGAPTKKTLSNALGFSTLVFGTGLRVEPTGTDGIAIHAQVGGGGIGTDTSGVTVASGENIPNTTWTNPTDATTITFARGLTPFSIGGNVYIGLTIPVSGASTFGAAPTKKTTPDGLGYSTLVFGTGLRVENTGTHGIVVHALAAGDGYLDTSGLTIYSGEAIPGISWTNPTDATRLYFAKGLQTFTAGGNTNIALTIPVSGSSTFGGSPVKQQLSNALGFSTLVFGTGLRVEPTGTDGIAIFAQVGGGGVGTDTSGVTVASGEDIPRTTWTNPTDATTLTFAKGLTTFDIGGNVYVGLTIPVSGASTFGGSPTKKVLPNGLGYSTIVFGTGLRVENTGTDGIVVHALAAGDGYLDTSGFTAFSGGAIPNVTWTDPTDVHKLYFGKGLQPFTTGGNTNIGLVIPVSGSDTFGGSPVKKQLANALGFSTLVFGTGLRVEPTGTDGIAIFAQVGGGGTGPDTSGVTIHSGGTIPGISWTNPTDATHLYFGKGLQTFTAGGNTNVGLVIPVSGSSTFGGSPVKQQLANALGFSTIVFGSGLRVEPTGTDGIAIYAKATSPTDTASGIVVISGDLVPTTTFTDSTQATEITFSRGLQPFQDGADMHIALSLPVSGIIDPTGTFSVDGVKVARSNALGFSSIAFGDGLMISDTGNGGLYVQKGTERGWINVLTDLTKLGIGPNAKADGVTDDGPAIQRAIDYVLGDPTKINKARNSIIFIPPGDYLIQTSITITSNNVFSEGLKIIGGGVHFNSDPGAANIPRVSATRLIWDQVTSGTDGPILTIRSCAALVLEDLSFFGLNPEVPSDPHTAPRTKIGLRMGYQGVGTMNQIVFKNLRFAYFERAFENRPDSDLLLGNYTFYNSMFSYCDVAFANWHIQGVIFSFYDPYFYSCKCCFWFLQGGNIAIYNGGSYNCHLLLWNEKATSKRFLIDGWFFDGNPSQRCRIYSDSPQLRNIISLANGTMDYYSGTTKGRNRGVFCFRNMEQSFSEGIDGRRQSVCEITPATGDPTRARFTLNYQRASDEYNFYGRVHPTGLITTEPIASGELIFLTGTSGNIYDGHHEVSGVSSHKTVYTADYDGTTNVQFIDTRTAHIYHGDLLASGFKPGMMVRISNSVSNDSSSLTANINYNYVIQTVDTGTMVFRSTPGNDLTPADNTDATFTSTVAIYEMRTPLYHIESGCSGIWRDGGWMFDQRGGSHIIVENCNFNVWGLDMRRLVNQQAKSWGIGGQTNSFTMRNCLIGSYRHSTEEANSAYAESASGITPGTSIGNSYVNVMPGVGTSNTNWYLFEDLPFTTRNLPPTGESNYKGPYRGMKYIAPP